MKNVAKCDTWCELQNPVNHRVFERKLRPKPSGRGHVCLGVTHRRPTPSPGTGGAGGEWPPVRSRSRLAQIRVIGDRSRDDRWCKQTPRTHVACQRRRNGTQGPCRSAHAELASRPQVRRDYPLSLSISISGGKETYQDSLSNGERTGNSPA